MGILDSVTSGKRLAPPRLLVYGVEGCGKSTFCSGAPSPVFIQTEDGLGQIDCSKFPLAIEVHPDNTVTGSVGGAMLAEGVIKSRRDDFLNAAGSS